MLFSVSVVLYGRCSRDGALLRRPYGIGSKGGSYEIAQGRVPDRGKRQCPVLQSVADVLTDTHTWRFVCRPEQMAAVPISHQGVKTSESEQKVLLLSKAH